MDALETSGLSGATQVCHATGAAYAFKLCKEARVADCIFGEIARKPLTGILEGSGRARQRTPEIGPTCSDACRFFLHRRPHLPERLRDKCHTTAQFVEDKAPSFCLNNSHFHASGPRMRKNRPMAATHFQEKSPLFPHSLNLALWPDGINDQLIVF